MKKGVIIWTLLLICSSTWAITNPGLNSPAQLQYGRTVIYKKDYLPFLQSYVKVEWPEGIRLVEETADTYVVEGKLARPIDNIQILHPSGDIDIPVKASLYFPVSTIVELAQPVKKVSIKGTFTHWSVNDTLLKPAGPLPTTDWKLSGLLLAEGYQQYKLVVNGAEVNPVNAPLTDNGMGGKNAVLEIGMPSAPTPFSYVASTDSESITVQAPNANLAFVYWGNQLIQKSTIPTSGKLVIRLSPRIRQSNGRSFIRVYTAGKVKIGNDLLLPLENGKLVTSATQLNRKDLHTQVMYFLMVDRFYNGDKNNDPKPLDSVIPKAQYMGGDLSGIEKQLQSGFFKQLGCNTIWLSPVIQNPVGSWGLWNKEVTTKFSGYHGYWPTSFTKVDSRFGNNLQFGQLVQTAHSLETNVVLDFVAHHIHIEHPMYREHPDWFTSLYLPDGTMNTERWDDHRLTTWFDVFLPTLNFERKEIRELMADSAMFWIRNYKLDGFRHDASKHVPESFWRTLTLKIKQEQEQELIDGFYQIGETYGSPELIGSYVNSGQMNAQFDFNLYDAAVSAFIDSKPNWNGLKRTIEESFSNYGFHHLMGNISGNQDRPRFASLADGSVSSGEDTKLAGYTRTITIQKKSIAFKRMAQLMALNMTLPGVPVIYYGDEYAMPGGNDPDNRRMMQFANYTQPQQQLVNKVKTLTSLRNNHIALLYGDYTPIKAGDDFFAYERRYLNQRIVVVFSKLAGRVSVPIETKQKPKSVMGHRIDKLDHELQFDMSNDDVAIFIIND